MKIPRIKSEWKRIIEYSDNHLNDFCIFRDLNGTWHATGIMGTGTWASEQQLFHSVSDTIDGKFKNLSPILTGSPGGEAPPQKHAPFVVEKDGVYHMYYRRPPGTMFHLKTTDPFAWKGLGSPVFERNDARDACIIKHENTYCMYYCQWDVIDGVERSCIFSRISENLEDWSNENLVFCDLTHTADHSRLESPFVVARPEGYYLFIRHRLMNEKCSTVVVFSRDFNYFECKNNPWIQVIDYVHAPEIVESDGRYYLARVSGPFDHLKLHAPEKGGWIDIAELEFN